MAVTIAFVLALLVRQVGLKPEPQLISTTEDERMKNYEEFVHQQMALLMEEFERSRAVEEAPHLSVLCCLTFGGILALLLVICWLASKRKHDSQSCSEQHSSSSEEDKDEDKDEYEDEDKDEDKDEGKEGKKEEKQDPSVGCNSIMAWAALTPLSNQGLPNRREALTELVRDLLAVCCVLSKRSFMPLLYTAAETDDASEAWSIHENSIAYHLVVFLRPAPGHSFRLEPDCLGKLPARHPSIRVVKECICSREQLLGDLLCLLHHTDEELRRSKSSYILDTLCTDSYLDVEKTACWVQMLVTSAWRYLPQSRYCQLTVLPSSHLCTFKMTNTSGMNVCIEMKLAVQHGSSGSYLRLE